MTYSNKLGKISRKYFEKYLVTDNEVEQEHYRKLSDFYKNLSLTIPKELGNKEVKWEERDYER